MASSSSILHSSRFFVFWIIISYPGKILGSDTLNGTEFTSGKTLILTDVDDIKAFFERAKLFQSRASQEGSRENSSRAFLPGVPAIPGGPGIEGATTNILTAAGTFLGAAAAAASANRPTGGTIATMTPAQQILAMRSCSTLNSAVCAPSGQCLLAGGVSIGNCAMGLMVCCINREEIPYGCSSSNNLVTIKDKSSTIVSTDDARSCQFEIYKTNSTICQLQMEFESFELDPPMWGEDCSTDSVMTISDSTTVRNGFPICGVHNGSKLYLAYGRSTRITLSFVSSPRSNYRIKIKQLDCQSPERIPDQCLENYDGLSGIVKSFGFPQYMINNQKYSICVNSRAVTDQGKITWRECSIQEAESDMENNFMLSEYFMEDTLMESSNQSIIQENYYKYYHYYKQPESVLMIPSEGPNCLKTSYVEIHGEEKHCGAKFTSGSKYAKSESRPFMLTVSFKEDIAENVPDYAMYRIPGIPRKMDGQPLTDPLPINDCEFEWNNSTYSEGVQMKPSAQGFEPCEIITKHKTGNTQYDLCLCLKKGNDIPERPKNRPDLLERKGFCLHYAIS